MLRRSLLLAAVVFDGSAVSAHIAKGPRTHIHSAALSDDIVVVGTARARQADQAIITQAAKATPTGSRFKAGSEPSDLLRDRRQAEEELDRAIRALQVGR